MCVSDGLLCDEYPCPQLERQLQMQQEMRARMMAQQMAMGREAFDWWAAFYGVAGLTLTAG